MVFIGVDLRFATSLKRFVGFEVQVVLSDL